MLPPIILNLFYAGLFIIVGAFIGTAFVVTASRVIPRLIDRMTPHIDEDKEILRGNQAVAEYFGRVASAAIIGVSIVVAAAVLGGILAGLHG
jgi:hypothetical protein